jgi:hypothetical protein
MFDSDSKLIYEAYMDLEKFQVKDLRGEIVKIHPNAGADPTDDTFMEWSVFINRDGGHRRIGMVKNIEISDCVAKIDHKDVNANQRSEEGGAKSPNVYVFGKVVDYDFSDDELNKKLSSDNWTSITYNPHKHPEYLKTDCLPDWWYDPRFFPVERGKRSSDEYRKGRRDAMKEFENYEFSKDCIVSKKISETTSGFKANRCILKQHATFDKREDYMWIA